MVKEKEEEKPNELLNEIQSQRNSLKGTAKALEKNKLQPAEGKTAKPSLTQDQTIETPKTALDKKSYFSKNAEPELNSVKKTKYFEDPTSASKDLTEKVEGKVDLKAVDNKQGMLSGKKTPPQVLPKDKSSKAGSSTTSSPSEAKKAEKSSNLIDLSPAESSATSSDNVAGFKEKGKVESTTRHSSTLQEISKGSVASSGDTTPSKDGSDKLSKVPQKKEDKGGSTPTSATGKDQAKDAREQKYVSTLTEEITFKGTIHLYPLC